ncbi:unnamed protein product, partial [Brassica oleracea var. botrytis]
MKRKEKKISSLVSFSGNVSHRRAKWGTDMLCCMNHVDEHAYTQLHLFSSKVEVSIFSSYFELILFHWPLMVLLPRFH